MRPSTQNRDLRSELERSALLLRTLRDEVRVQLHLGRLEAKQEWDKLESRVEAALERAAHDVTDASREAVTDLIAAVREIRDARR